MYEAIFSYFSNSFFLFFLALRALGCLSSTPHPPRHTTLLRLLSMSRQRPCRLNSTYSAYTFGVSESPARLNILTLEHLSSSLSILFQRCDFQMLSISLQVHFRLRVCIPFPTSTSKYGPWARHMRKRIEKPALSFPIQIGVVPKSTTGALAFLLASHYTAMFEMLAQFDYVQWRAASCCRARRTALIMQTIMTGMAIMTRTINCSRMRVMVLACATSKTEGRDDVLDRVSCHGHLAQFAAQRWGPFRSL